MLPQEIKVKLCSTEEEHFKNHSKALKNYMLKVEVDLTVVTSPSSSPISFPSPSPASTHAPVYTHIREKIHTSVMHTCINVVLKMF